MIGFPKRRKSVWVLDLRIFCLMAIGVGVCGIIDGSFWHCLLSPTISYRTAILLALSLVFGWRGLAWSQIIYLLVFTWFHGWAGLLVVPINMVSYTGAFVAARRISNGESWFSTERSTLAFLASAVLVQALPALMSDTILTIIGAAPRGLPGTIDSWLRGSAGILVLTPAVLVYSGQLRDFVGLPPDSEWNQFVSLRDAVQLVGEILTWTVALWLTILLKARYDLNITYLTFLPPLAFALSRGVRLSALALAGNAIVATTLWAWLGSLQALSAVDLRLLLTISSLTAIVLAVLVDERERDRNHLAKLRIEEAVLRESERHFRTLANTAPVMIWVSDPHQHCTFVNKQLLEFIGRTAEEQSGSGWIESFHSEDVARYRDTYNSFFRQRKSFSVEYRLRRFDGEYRSVFESGGPFYKGDEFAGYIGSCVDVTELKRNQQLQKLTAGLLWAQETASRELARELHDVFSQQIAAIGLGIQSVKKDAERQPKFSSRLAEIAAAVEHLAKGIYRTSRQLHPAVLEALGLEAALAQECHNLQSQFRISTYVDVHGDLTDLSSESVLCLYRVAQESLRNISKHARTATSVRLSVTGTCAGATLAIKDNGGGFEPDTARKSGGLGLISMEERIRLVNGTFNIRTTVGGGTIIEVFVPRESTSLQF